MRTRERIIHASIELFNEHGERNITTNHIASHLGISPGNLYYHFRNKEDIISHIFELYRQQLESSFGPVDADQDAIALLRHSLDAVFELMWRFSFFYANLPDILSRDEKLQSAYHQVQAAQLDRMKKAIIELKSKGVLNIEDEDISDFSNSLKINVIFWISYLKIQHPNAKVKKGMIYQGVLTVLSLLKPYLNTSDKGRIKALQQHYMQLSQQDCHNSER